jgi:hypothetical protein
VAVGLLNSSSRLVANVTESGGYTWPSALTGLDVSRSAYLSAQVVGHTAVSFAPALGLFPANLTGPQTWNSSAAFTADAAAQWSYYLAASGPAGTTTVTHAGMFDVPVQGNVTLQGNYSPLDDVTLGGVAYPAIQLTVTGPFSIREGVILLPSSADIFGGGSTPWQGNETSTASASMSAVDARLTAGGHFGLGASAMVFRASGQNPANSLASVGGQSAGVTSDLSSGVDQAPTTTVQAEPENVSQAVAQQGCFVSGASCPSASGPAASVRGLLGLAIIGAVVVVVVGSLVLVAERRRMPPPPYPNATLYPPGGSSSAIRGAAPKDPPPPQEDDPLGNLW